MLQKRLNRSLAKLRRGDKRGLMMTATGIARGIKTGGEGCPCSSGFFYLSVASRERARVCATAVNDRVIAGSPICAAVFE